MNKYQIALDEIKKQLVVVDYLNGKAVSQEPIFEEQTEILQELVDIYPEYLELKERVTPKKPNILPIQEFAFFECPTCRDKTQIGKFTFCQKCGQTLDWSESTTDSVHNELDNIFADDLEMLERLKIKK